MVLPTNHQPRAIGKSVSYVYYVLIGIGVLLLGFIILGLISPRMFMRTVMTPWLTMCYRKEIVGLENLPTEKGCVVVSNHVSWIDGILILWMLPRNVRFVVDGGNFNNRALDWIAGAFDTILMTASPKSIGRALKTARSAIDEGDVVGIFPEGTLTRTGQLQAFRPGVKKILKDPEALVVPMWLEGMWGSIFSFSGGKFFWKWPKQYRRTITLRLGEPLKGAEPLEFIRSRVQELGARSKTDRRNDFPILASKVIRVWRKAGRRLQAADSLGTELSGRDLLIRTLILRRVLRREVFSNDEQFVGVLLPPSAGGVSVNVALAMDQRISANLNYTVSSSVLNHCIQDVGVKHILTTEKFMSKMDFELDAELVMLDSIRNKVTAVDKLIGFLQARFVPGKILDRILGLHKVDGDDTLTVIFTSGSTGMPKGVLLSNANVSHNVSAVDSAVKLDHNDTVLGILPFFHSFGYAVTLWTVNTVGPKGIYHFNPLDARQIGKLAEKYKVTVILATPTFLRGYLRRIKPEQFKHMDVVVVGAEKMPAELFDSFEKKFGVRPVEGYGATELSPLVSVNIPPSRSAAKYQKDRIEGSVGRPLPSVSVKVVSTDDGSEMEADQDGMLLVTGPNVMKGYANRDDLTEKAIQDGWYETGDIARIDKDGFLHITGRLSRFSKIGGEMVPHVRVEEEIARLLTEGDDDEEIRACVTAVPCPKKGEKLIVLHKATEVSIDTILNGLREQGLPNLFIPSADAFIKVDSIPMLGTGKLDLKKAKDIATQSQAA